MNLDRYIQRSCCALGAALALAAATAFADASAPQLSAPETTVKVAVADSAEAVRAAPNIYPSSAAGLRRAAAQGPLALHLYIYRTRMIYNYYIWDFATQE